LDYWKAGESTRICALFIGYGVIGSVIRKVIDNGEAGDIELIDVYDIIKERAAANRFHILGILTDTLK